MRILSAVEDVNNDQKLVLYKKLVNYYGKIGGLSNSQSNFEIVNDEALFAACEKLLAGKTIAIWGLAFKPETDDMREAPSLVLIDKLLKAGCHVRAYDPIAMVETKHRIGDKIDYAKDIYDAVLGADALMLLTEWKEFRLPSWAAIKKLMNTPVVFDGRNIYQIQDLKEAGFDYHCIGKRWLSE